MKNNRVAITIPDGPYSGFYDAYLDVVNDRLKSGRRRMLRDIANSWPEIWFNERKSYGDISGREACKSFPDYMLAVILCQL